MARHGDDAVIATEARKGTTLTFCLPFHLVVADLDVPDVPGWESWKTATPGRAPPGARRISVPEAVRSAGLLNAVRGLHLGRKRG